MTNLSINILYSWNAFYYKTHLMVADHVSFIMIIWSDFIKRCFKSGPISNKVHMCTITFMLNMKQNITSFIIYVLNSHVSSVDYDCDHSINQSFGTIGNILLISSSLKYHFRALTSTVNWAVNHLFSVNKQKKKIKWIKMDKKDKGNESIGLRLRKKIRMFNTG